MAQLVLPVMTMVYAVVNPISWMTNVMSVMLVSLSFRHVKVNNTPQMGPGTPQIWHTFTKLEIIFIISGCNCYGNGSNGIACDANGVCSCKANFMNDKCDACNVGFFNFPTCEGNQYINPTLIKLDLTFFILF